MPFFFGLADRRDENEREREGEGGMFVPVRFYAITWKLPGWGVYIVDVSESRMVNQ